MLYLCLVEPEIPQNTGNIARTCAVTDSVLVLVHPLGFSLSEKAVRRSGMDYWKDVKLEEEESFSSFMEKHKNDELFFFSSHGERSLYDVSFPAVGDIYLVFGKESTGLGDKIISRYASRLVRIPMIEGKRCLNLSTSAAVAAYEVLRQRGFKGVI